MCENEKNRLIIVYSLLFIMAIIISYPFFFGEINNINDYIFSILYFILSFYILSSNPQNYIDDCKFMLSYNFILLVIALTTSFQFFIGVKICILISIAVGVTKNFNLINNLKSSNETIKYLSAYDELTNVYNRRQFEEELRKLEDRKSILPVSIIVGDVNDLKYINDNYGHAEGDNYLKNAAKLLRSMLRKDDIIARIGGDEFAIILPETGSAACERIIERIQSSSDDYAIPVNIALGYATNLTRTKNLEDTMNKADTRMYKNKRKMKGNKNRRSKV